MKIRPVGAELFHADGQTRHDKTNSRFSQFSENVYEKNIFNALYVNILLLSILKSLTTASYKGRNMSHCVNL